MDLTGFLFGNVDEEGQLEDEAILDRVMMPILFEAHQTISRVVQCCSTSPSALPLYHLKFVCVCGCVCVCVRVCECVCVLYCSDLCV